MNNTFDKIYLINMEERTDRYASMELLFNKIGVTDFELIRPLAPDSFTGQSKLQPTMLSCKEAHLRIYRDAIEKGYRKIMIFEDDCVLNQDDASIERDIEYHLSRCRDFVDNNDFDLFYYDNIFVAKKRDMQMYEFARLITDKEVQRFKGKPFSHSYVITASAAQRMLDFSASRDENIDNDLQNLASDKKYFYTRGIFDQKLNERSDNTWNTDY
ncbi:MAG TPA: glycosyltransferase family 25 protein [Paludibacter sp.]|nr:glycosyltransferase family 25 protein [Paludibacter sp.]